jgi:Fic family protein
MLYDRAMKLETILANIDQLKNELDSLRPLTADQVHNLKRLFDIDFTFNSTAIEGNTFSLQETRIVLLDGITIGGKSTREHLEIVNHKEAIDFIESISQKKLEDYRRTDILNIHYLVLKGIDSENAGKLRVSPVYVRLKNGSIHKFTDPVKLTDEMDGFFSWFFAPKAEHPVLIAAEAHTRFVSIHPFVDGNGRTARLIMNLILFHYGFSPAVIKVSQRSQYLDSMEEWQQNQNKESFQQLLAISVLESLEIYVETIKKGVIWK